MATLAHKGEEGIGWGLLGILLLGRTVFNTAFRLVYPLLAFMAGDLRVDLQTASLLVTIQVGATLLSPLGGALSDRRGERMTMLLGLGIFCGGALICALAGGFWPFMLGYGLIGVGTALYMPAVQSFASNRTPYAQRGRVLGFLELTWALAALVGVTGLTLLVQAQDRTAPAFWALLGLGLLVMAGTLTSRELGAEGRPAEEEARSAGREKGAAEREGLLAALAQPGVPIFVLFIFAQLMAVELIFVVYAAWLERSFGASTEQLGLVFGLLGVVELVGALGATLLTDRLGKRRAVLGGFALTGILLGLLPLSEGRWVLFLVIFLLFDMFFEFAVVSSFPLISGLAKHGRGTVMAASVSALGLGRVAGSLVGPQIFAQWGFWVNGGLAAAIALAGVALGVWLLREGEH